MDDLFQSNKGPTYYEMLNCVPTSNKEQITAEYRVLAKKYHPDKNKYVEDGKCEEESIMYLKVTKAYKTLSDDVTRKDYDKWMNSGLCVTYDRWTELSKATHTSLHWGCMKNEQLSLANDRNDNESTPPTTKTDEEKQGDVSAINPSLLPTLTPSSSNNGLKRSTNAFNSGNRRSKFRKYEI